MDEQGKTDKCEATSQRHEKVGFDYAQAMVELLKRFTYREIADHLGYNSVGSITAVLGGKIPSHLHGEALWLLYRDTFGRRPPLSGVQQIANSLTE